MFRPEWSASNFADQAFAPGVVSAVVVRLARREATLVSIERDLVTCRHSSPLKLAALVPLAVIRNGRSFAANATVLSCRVAALGAGEGGSTLYETRVQLDDLEEASDVLRLLGDDFR
jgi:hypothetical protein